MNKYCNTLNLLKGYNYINKIILDLEIEEYKLLGLNDEAAEAYDELRGLSYNTELIVSEQYVEDVPLKSWLDDPDFKSWHRTMGRVYNEKNKWKYIIEVRNLTQNWIDTIKLESRINHSDFVDNIIFTLNGCKSERKRFLVLFNNIINDLIDRLDALDGGYKNNIDQQAELKAHSAASHKVGFGR